MSFTFIFTNDYNIGIEQLIAILKSHSVPTDIIFSKYNFHEVAHLQYMAKHEDAESGEKAKRLLDLDRERIINEIKQKRPRLIGFSVTTDSYQWCLAIADRIKEDIPDLPIIMGGAHPTFVPERVISQQCVDAVCIGEADLSIVDLYSSFCGSAKKEDVFGAWFKIGRTILKNRLAPLVQDLNSLPFKDISLLVKVNPAIGQRYIALASRGCPFNCSYCNSSSYKKMYGKGYLRKRSSENMLDELEYVKKLYNPQRILFVDDVFTMDYVWLKKFLPQFKKKIRLPYYCLIHPDAIKKDTLKLLKETGCETIKCGIQSINPRICKYIYNRSLNLDRIRQVIHDTKEFGIPIKVDFIIGGPTETEKDLMDLVEFIKEIKVTDIFLYFLKYYPGSKAIKYALENGYITKEEFESCQEGSEMAYYIIPERFKGKTRDMYNKYYKLIRNAAGSKWDVEQFRYLLEDIASRQN